MARDKKGFNLDSLNKIVNMDIKDNVNKDVTNDIKDNVKKDSKSNANEGVNNEVNVDVNKKLINEMIVDKVDKVRFSTYIEPENWDKLKAYGDHLGRKSGGATKLLNIALAEFFENHDL
ncbi:hypothetical protein [Periweissella fabalis]|uniref:Uncharacterized protein n=1 Tax=Periweissella fabalis TaxID=1070421 RepID=A0A7X6N6S9_9LACO|nr:hypothetical protein [Periweissella fabalis]MCM0598415.1 hypothetical protein [Periweissella fabalis]NKZ25060.1 hypothetical protein [Periweissella fabalis]